MKKSQLIPSMKPNVAYVAPGIKANLNYIELSGFKYYPQAFEIKFDYQNQRQIETMKNKYNLDNGHYDHFFYSRDKSKIDGVVINSEKMLEQLLTEFIEFDHMSVTVGETMIGGKYDEDAKKVVKTNIAEMRQAPGSQVLGRGL